MHELSIAMCIVDLAEEELSRRANARVHAVRLRLGQFSGVVKEALLSSYEMACASTQLEGSQLLIEEVAVEIYCAKCQRKRPVASIQHLCCADCGSPGFDIIQGKELEVVALEVTE